jgi:FkbM family methyltransferase
MTLLDIAKGVIGLTPYRVSRSPPNRFGAIQHFMRRMAGAGHRPDIIIDGGAHSGWFALAAHAAFPEAEIRMIEPQPSCAPILKGLADRHGLHFHPVAITSERKVVRMICDEVGLDTGANIAQAGELGRANLEVQGVSLDELFAADCRSDVRVLLKLDLQGHELEALRGATRLLRSTDLVLTEVSFFVQMADPTIAEIVRFCDEAGFDLYDVVAIAGRRRDDRARQADFVFVRRNTALWADRSWE